MRRTKHFEGKGDVCGRCDLCCRRYTIAWNEQKEVCASLRRVAAWSARGASRASAPSHPKQVRPTQEWCLPIERMRRHGIEDAFGTNDPGDADDDDAITMPERIPYTLYSLEICRPEPRDPIHAYLKKIEPEETLRVQHKFGRRYFDGGSRTENFGFLVKQTTCISHSEISTLRGAPKTLYVFWKSFAMIKIQESDILLEKSARPGDISNPHIKIKKITSYDSTLTALLNLGLPWNATIRSLARAGYSLVSCSPKENHFGFTRCWSVSCVWTINIPVNHTEYYCHLFKRTEDGVYFGRKYSIFGGKHLPFLRCGSHHRLDSVMVTGISSTSVTADADFNMLCNGSPIIQLLAVVSDIPGHVSNFGARMAEAEGDTLFRPFSATLYTFKSELGGTPGRCDCSPNLFAKALHRHFESNSGNSTFSSALSTQQKRTRREESTSGLLARLKKLDHRLKINLL